jgi:hypothetical protein
MDLMQQRNSVRRELSGMPDTVSYSEHVGQQAPVQIEVCR